MDTVPVEILEHIAVCCSLQALLTFQSLSVRHRAVVSRSPVIWRASIQRNYPSETILTALNSNNRLLIVAMLKAGVDVNQPSERTFPLIYCLQKRRESLAKLLIESGAKDLVSNNSTPLMLMLEHGYFDLAASFIKKTECMANVMNQCGVTVFGLACKRKQTQICELLVPHLDFTWKNVHSRTHLHEASRYGMPSICQKLLDGGVDPNQADFQHNTPLHESVRHCCFQTTRLLLEHGANPNTVNNWGMYPLMIAAELHDLPTMEILLEHGADPNLSGSRDCTALFAAVYKSNLNGVKLLLKHGADPNHKNYLSRTVLHEALRSREMEMVSLFLKEDPSLDTEDHFGETPVMYCIYHDIRIFDQLLEAGWKPALQSSDSWLHVANNCMKQEGVDWWKEKLCSLGMLHFDLKSDVIDLHHNGILVNI